jgi:raffinose/stachyose/melibiose transport system substrate-binding protein
MKRKQLGAVVGVLLGVAGLAATAEAATAIRVLALVPDDKEKETALNADIAKEYAASHPGVTVEFEYLDNEAFKAKLPTLLQSSKRPDIFQSWGGGGFEEQVKAGVLQDVTAIVKQPFSEAFSPSTIDKYTVNGKIYGGFRDASAVLIWYNKELAAKAGVDVPSIKTWDDFLAAVKKAKSAGVTPIIMGGKDKWPTMFFYGYLALRLAGADGFVAARAGKDGGFENPAFIKAAEEYRALVDLKPFQEGFADATFEKAAGMFGDGKALFHLTGTFGYGVHQRTSADGKGVPDGKLGVMPFPAVKDGRGDPSEIMGGIGGWVMTAAAPKEAAQFLTYFSSKKPQERAAKEGLWIPSAKGAGEALNNPFFKEIAGWISGAKRLQLYLDQALGPQLGAAINEVSADLAFGVLSPKDAAAQIEEARKMAQ